MRYSYECEFEGTLHIWTTCDLDLKLRAEASTGEKFLAADENSGGGTTPYIRLEVELGDSLVILIDYDEGVGPSSSSFALDLIAAPESAETREVSAEGTQAAIAADELIEAGDRGGAADFLSSAVSMLHGAIGAKYSQSIADAFWELGFAALRAGRLNLRFESWNAALVHRERTLPPDHLYLDVALPLHVRRPEAAPGGTLLH